ncbi:hypothetical protein [Pantoea septica]|uniref:hypothetical protein n=1 Tax=Pantoea septica TaxID=472695 RepID=UPI003D012F37
MAFNRHYSLFFPGSQRSMTTKWGRFEAHQGLKENFFSPLAWLRRSRFALLAAQRKKPRKARPIERHVDSVRCEAFGPAKKPKKYILVIIAKLTCFHFSLMSAKNRVAIVIK